MIASRDSGSGNSAALCGAVLVCIRIDVNAEVCGSEVGPSG